MNSLTKPNLFIWFLSAVIAFGCDDTPEETEYTIIGQWKFTDSRFEQITIEGQEIIDFYINELGLSEAEANEKEFPLRPPSFASLTWTFDAEILHVQSPDTSWTEPYTHHPETNELILDDGAYEVLKLDRNELKVRYFMSMSLPIDGTLYGVSWYTYFDLERAR